MKRIQTSIADFPFTLEVPSSVEEFNEIHKRDNAVLDQAVNYDVAHTVLGRYRTAFVEALIERGAKRTILSGEGTENVVYGKTDQKWIKASVAELGLTNPEVSAILQSISDERGYDVSGSGRGENDYTQVDLRNSKQIVSAISVGQGSYARVKANLEERNPGVTIEVDEHGAFTAEQLAPAMKAERLRVAAAAQAGILG